MTRQQARRITAERPSLLSVALALACGVLLLPAVWAVAATFAWLVGVGR